MYLYIKLRHSICVCIHDNMNDLLFLLPEKANWKYLLSTHFLFFTSVHFTYKVHLCIPHIKELQNI